MKPYHILTVSKPLDWDRVPCAAVSCVPWGGEYCPETSAQLYCLRDNGFFLRMSCLEGDPVAIYQQENDPVYRDSCLECFLQFHPGKGYLNLEMNANGAVLCQYGKSRFDRKFLTELGLSSPKVTVEKQNDRWSVAVFLPFELIEQLDQEPVLEEIREIRGNFYKCGDETPVLHYLSWHPMTSSNPDFHRPEDFGRMELIVPDWDKLK